MQIQTQSNMTSSLHLSRKWSEKVLAVQKGLHVKNVMEYEVKIRSTATHTVIKESPLSLFNRCKKQVFQTSREGKEGKGGVKRHTGYRPSGSLREKNTRTGDFLRIPDSL